MCVFHVFLSRVQVILHKLEATKEEIGCMKEAENRSPILMDRAPICGSV